MSGQWWFICDKGICLYSAAAVERMSKRIETDPRCIKHGALLISDPAYDGLSRARAREKLHQ